MSATRAEVVAAVRGRFTGDCADAVLAVLDRYGAETWERERERVQLAIVELSEGSQDKLAELVQSAKQDYRDILAWVETGPLDVAEGQRLREAALGVIGQWGKAPGKPS